HGKAANRNAEFRQKIVCLVVCSYPSTNRAADSPLLGPASVPRTALFSAFSSKRTACYLSLGGQCQHRHRGTSGGNHQRSEPARGGHPATFATCSAPRGDVHHGRDRFPLTPADDLEADGVEPKQSKRRHARCSQQTNGARRGEIRHRRAPCARKPQET